MHGDMSALNLEGIQEVMTTMGSFDSVFKDISEQERNIFLEMVIKRTLEKPEYQTGKVQSQSKNRSIQEVITSLSPQEVATAETQSASRIYSEKWFVIQNRLLNAITDLELNERRLIMFLSPVVRKAVDADPTQRIFTVAVKDFANEYGIKGKYLYEELETIADSILEKVFFFWYDYKGNQAKKGVSWVSECDYIENEGLVRVKLDDTVIEMLTVFDKANPFTKYERKMIVNLGSYGVILFELIASCMHQQHKQKAYTIEYLRAKFNCVDTYLVLADFKRYVIDKAIKDIEAHTPYRISYTQNKKGRIIHEIVFSFEDTREKALKDGKGKSKGLERAPNSADMLTNYNDKQLARAVHSKKFIADYNGLIAAQNPANQSSDAWISHMVEWVKKDPERFTKRPAKEYLDDEQAPRF
ncbi:replication initiation protein [Psychrobacter sanguinis]|nr:replication initiation protein [Psychrobacter sanguinis]